MKKFSVNCDFGGQMSPFAVYIGVPEGSHHPVHFQADWLSKNRGGTIPHEFMESISQLQNIADKNKVSLEELCVYALGAAQQELEENSSQTEDSNLGEYSDDGLDELFDFDDSVSEPRDDGVKVSDEELEEINEKIDFDDDYLEKIMQDVDNADDIDNYESKIPSLIFPEEEQEKLKFDINKIENSDYPDANEDDDTQKKQ